MPTLVTDIDHTLAYSRRRDHLEGSWEEYNSDSINDAPVPDTIAVVRALHRAGWWTVALTARPEKWRALTIQWLVANEVPFDELMMRPNGCFDRAPILKVNAVRSLLRSEVTVVMDDRLDVVEALKEEGVTVLHVHAGRQP